MVVAAWWFRKVSSSCICSSRELFRASPAGSALRLSMTMNRRPSRFDRATTRDANSPGRELGRVDLDGCARGRFDIRLDVHAELRLRRGSVPAVPRRREEGGASPRRGARLQRTAVVVLPTPAGRSASVLVPRDPPPSSVSSSADPVTTARSRRRCGGRGDQAREHIEPARVEIGKSCSRRWNFIPAHLDDAQTPPLGAVLARCCSRLDHAVRDAVQLEVAGLGGPVVEQEHGAARARRTA